MHLKPTILVAFATISQARFGQESAVQDIIQAISNFGPPGAAGTLAGQTPGVLLAGASACAKVLDSVARLVLNVGLTELHSLSLLTKSSLRSAMTPRS